MKTTRIYSVCVDVPDGSGPNGDCVRTCRFTSQMEADDFKVGKTIYGRPVTGVVVDDVPAKVARRWVMTGQL